MRALRVIAATLLAIACLALLAVIEALRLVAVGLAALTVMAVGS